VLASCFLKEERCSEVRRGKRGCQAQEGGVGGIRREQARQLVFLLGVGPVFFFLLIHNPVKKQQRNKLFDQSVSFQKGAKAPSSQSLYWRPRCTVVIYGIPTWRPCRGNRCDHLNMLSSRLPSWFAPVKTVHLIICVSYTPRDGEEKEKPEDGGKKNGVCLLCIDNATFPD